MRILRPQRQGGFTMLELIMVIILMGILSAVVLPRFARRLEFEGKGFFNQTEGMIRYAQKTAIAQRRNVSVQINSTDKRICLTYQAASLDCAADGVADPDGGLTFSRDAPTDVNFDATSTITFTALGRLTGNANMQVTVTQNGAPAAGTITVEAATGYVH